MPGTSDRSTDLAAPPGDLLTPTLAEHRPRSSDAPAPWNLGSQVYVAFLGGALAVTAIAYLNSARLEAPTRTRMVILLIGLLSFASILVVAALLGQGEDTPSGFRVALQLVAVAGWGLMFLIQRPYERIFETFDDTEHASLVWPGLAAIVTLGALQLLAVVAVIG